MKKIIALGLAVAGAVWAVSKSRGDKPKDVWAGATDEV
jgi:hypothetical protein